MTAKDNRLARLLAIRTVALRTASRDLSRAIVATGGVRGLARRIDELRLELMPIAVQSSGFQLKANLATRTGLTLAAARQGLRLDTAQAKQADATLAVHRGRAETEAVERTIERRNVAQVEADDQLIGIDQPARRLAR